MCLTPSTEPGKLIPRPKKIISTTYGNVAVKQTACKPERNSNNFQLLQRCELNLIRPLIYQRTKTAVTILSTNHSLTLSSKFIRPLAARRDIQAPTTFANSYLLKRFCPSYKLKRYKIKGKTHQCGKCLTLSVVDHCSWESRNTNAVQLFIFRKRKRTISMSQKAHYRRELCSGFFFFGAKSYL